MSNVKAIILAAGMGARISSEIENIPKSLLKISGKSILRKTVELLRKRNIDVIVCTGFKHEMIEKELEEYEVTYFYNPFYSVSNNIGSLWFAQQVFDSKSSVIIISADVVMEEEMLDKIERSATHGMIMFGDKSRVMDGDYFLKVKDEEILDYGESLSVEDRDYEYVCVTAISGDCANIFRQRLQNMIEAGHIHDYYEHVVFSFIGDSKNSPICVDVTGLKWHEIDRIEDYYVATEKFC